MNEFKFELGSTVQDVITEVKGIVSARSQYLTSCNTYGILRRGLDKDGNAHKWVWVDEPRLKSATGKKVILVDPKKRKTGGPHSRNECPKSR